MYKILLLISGLVLGNCETLQNERKVPITNDLKLICKEFKLPGEIKNIEIKRNLDTGGTYGREGLRIYARFLFTRKQLAEYLKKNQQWKPLPLPEKILKFKEAPMELPQNLKNGYYYCTVWFYNIDFNKSKTCDCNSEKVKTKYREKNNYFDNYRVGIIDKNKMELFIIYKNYY